ncbi:hypothetical protein SF1_42410 [Sphingobacterium faecium NBRC 15299]|uniref:hypothetical protein n=1 Tax=Sphingobacterium faecium TaxID=34087 RepID=UPI000D3C8E11|nr:hypothetical protein [Sphingobacterium faecium]PTX10183.1 hypothetical protein C8N37_105191 [Sphingobacterium faecium]GEM66259.1 hypothetical protein SF1_42410 [Sphingobacterium faecium NBRC 15299]
MAKTKVLITVTTYPLPSRSYDELVCTAGIKEDGTWIRIYPVPLKFLKGVRDVGKMETYKFTWISLQLEKRRDDFRPESHSPRFYDFRDFEIFESVPLSGSPAQKVDAWNRRIGLVNKNIYFNMTDLISDSRDPKNISLATFKPTKILDFIVEDDDAEWKNEWKEQLRQLDLFSNENDGKRELIKKIPFKFYYKFEDDQGRKSRLMIEDWEIGQLYFNCLKKGDKKTALEKVREKYWSFFKGRDIYFFLGTTMQWHRRRSDNPFVIIGVFYPPVITTKYFTSDQLSLDF